MIRDEAAARAFVEELCDATAMERLGKLVATLRVENTSQNLVAENTLDVVWQRHIADSAQLLTLDQNVAGPWLDLGSGAGFPGVVIAVVRPEIPVILVESRSKRVDWLNRCIDRLGLTNCRVEGQTLERVEAFQAGTISARAFAPLDRLLRLSARFSTSHTLWLLPKGRSAAQEVEALRSPRKSMFHVKQSLTSEEAGIIIGRGQWKDKA